VKSECGWSRLTGAMPLRGAIPSRIRGTALVVESYEAYAFGNHVASAASAAKLG
jgi:hypothetical protein